MKTIDLRSDTVTLPTPKMRQAMAEAPLGDDVFGEDPTVRQLEELAAARLEKEAGLFVSSGTMANLVAILTHCGRGDEVILGRQCHVFRYEAGGMSALGGVHSHQLEDRPDGTLDLEQIAKAVRPDNVHYPRTRLICLENTHNRCGGAVMGPEYTVEVARLAAKHGLLIHLDGARLFNAAVALGIEVCRLGEHADSVSICLSKGLAAPVGSVLCGSTDFVARARRVRKMVGGGMRQCGVLAAAGIVALEEMVDRLADDHANARRLAEGLASIDGLSVDLDRVATNMVYFRLATDRLTSNELVERLGDRGVKCSSLDVGGFRMVTHHGIEPNDVDRAVEITSDVMSTA